MNRFRLLILYKICFLIILLFGLTAGQPNRIFGQEMLEVVTLEICLHEGQKNFPLLRQRFQWQESLRLEQENQSRIQWPQFSIQGQATIQSEVTGIPITLPNLEIPVLSKDQYRLFAEANQSLTDFFTLPDMQALTRQQYNVEQQKLEVESFRLEEKIMDLFFQIILIRSQEDQVSIMKKDVQAGLTKVNSAVENGILLPLAADQLMAEMFRIDQKEIELRYKRKGLTDVLSTWVGKKISENAVWILPESVQSRSTGERPEILLLSEQQKMSDARWKVAQNKQLPRIGAFFQVGAGRPGLNMLSNDLDMYWIGGLRMNWNISSWYTLGREQKILSVQKEIIETQKENLSMQLNAADSQLQSDIIRVQKLTEKDEEILKLRERIQSVASSQLEQGIVTASEYLNFVHQTDLARQNIVYNQIQMRKMQFQLLHARGIRFSSETNNIKN